MQYLLLENVSKSYGDKVLFENINLSITKGEKIALVAKNGSGKTTLLRVIAGEEGVEGENSMIHIAKEIRIAYLKQDPYFNSEDTIIDAIFQSDTKDIQAVKAYENALLNDNHDEIKKYVSIIEDLKAWDVEAKVEEILGKLKITDLNKTINQLSGGQIKRLALAQILIEEPDFLILDEPTNHLDLEMIEWLENYLQRSQLTVFMVTHDRYFLERICTEILELDKGDLFTYRGNYSDFLEKKALKDQNEAVNLAKSKKLFKKELEWIRRQPKARTTKAKSRIDKFYNIKDKANQRLDNAGIEFFIQSARLGSKICELHHVEKGYDEVVLINDFSYKFKKNERLGIVGPNGAGKSTLLKIITKEINPDRGRVVLGETVVFGHFTQSGLNLNEDKRVIDVIRDIAEYIPLEKGQKLTAESLLEKFLFPRSNQRIYVSQLSGGEKRRLHLLTILMQNPNFLILDEPTNDLDILTLNILEEYLLSYKGVLIIVTHDRYFMDKLVDHLFVLQGNGMIKDFNGTYTEFRELNSWSSDTSKVKKGKPTEVIQEEKLKVSYSDKMEFQTLEKEIDILESRKTTINQIFMDTSMDGETISQLSIELGEVNKKLEVSEERWMELAEKIMK